MSEPHPVAATGASRARRAGRRRAVHAHDADAPGSRGLLAERILVLDGAMGTMLQAYEFDEAAFRGDRFRDHPRDLRGDNDLLTLTQPDAVRAVHAAYLDAGADIVSTNTFTATRIAQADYGLDAAVVREINVAAARLARAAADAAERADPGRPALRRRCPRPDQPDRVDQPGRGRPGGPGGRPGPSSQDGLPRGRGRLWSRVAPTSC